MGTPDDVRKSTKALSDQLQETRDGLDGLAKGIGDLFAMGTAARGPGGVSTAFSDLAEATGAAGNAVDQTAKGFGAFASKIPYIGDALDGMANAVGVTAGMIGKAAEETILFGKTIVNALDEPSKQIRAFDNEIFQMGKTFGGTIEESRKFADSLKKETVSDFAQSMHMTAREMGDFVTATNQTSLSLGQLSETVDTGIGVTTLYAVAAGQAAAMGIGVGQAATLINTAMNKQGKSAQEAAEMLGMFSGVAETVGLKANTVASTLNGAIQRFQKLGMAADFGRPILEGFGRVMNNLGLGIEEATGLTQTLGGALAGLTNDYANAYIMFQRGGLDIGGGGGGGVLGASIGMQAALLEADQTGDQGAIGAQLVTGLRDTLESFTGGSIVTVQQAAESPELQNQFYVQQQLLKSQFGIGDDASATRVLDLLADIDNASRSGDKEAQKMLQEQLSKEVEGRDKTLDEWEKANRNLEVQSNLAAVSSRALLEMSRGYAASAREGIIDPLVNAGGEMAISKLEDLAESLGLEADSEAFQQFTSPSIPTTRQDQARRAISNAAGGGPLDTEGTLQAWQELSPTIVDFNANLNTLAENIDRTSQIIAGQATSEEIKSAGFGDRMTYATEIGNVIAEAFSNKFKIEIDLTENAKGALSVGSQVALVGGG